MAYRFALVGLVAFALASGQPANRLDAAIPLPKKIEEEPKKDPIKATLAKLQGAWYSLGTQQNGQARDPEDPMNIHIITGATFAWKINGEIVQRGNVKIVEVKGNLVKIDMHNTEGISQGDTFMVLCEVNGDRITWCGCNQSTGLPRPTAVQTAPGDGYWLRMLKREK